MNMLRSMKIFGTLSFWLVSAVTIFSPAERAEAQLRCYDCHGTRSTGDYRPLDAPTRDMNSGGFVGNHRTHLAPEATAANCNPCHHAPDAVPALYSAHHRDHRIQVAENINNSPHPDKAGYYKNGEKAVLFNQTEVPLLGSCQNVNCHFENVTLIWGSDPLTRDACTTCHGAPPGYGAHVKHGALLGMGTTSCSRCHTDHPSEPDPLAHARQAGSRPLYIRFSGAANRSGVYTAGAETEYPNYLPSQHPTRNGSCANLYCHSSGKATAIPQPAPPEWSGPPLGCNGCHGTGTTTGAPDYANDGEGAALANSHPGHMDNGRICADCHIGTTATGTIIVAGSTLHINSQLDVIFKNGGSYDNQAKTCGNTICHFTAIPVWGGALAADCSGCHGGNAASVSAIATGRHTAHMNNYSTLGLGNNLGCAACHAHTVDSDRHISNRVTHFNKIKDYSGAKAGRIVTAGSGRCTNSYCHSSGTKENQYWNMSSSRWESGTSFNCSGCHGTLTLPDGTFQAYTSVAGEPNYPNTGIGTPLANSHQKHVVGSQDDTTGCSRCHRSTGDATIAGKLRDYTTAHLDRERNVRFTAAIQGRYSATSQQCLNLYCHSNGEPFDNSTAVYLTATWGDSNSTSCGSCHGDTAGAGTLSGRHGKHTASTIYESSCDRCHTNTINADGSLKDKKLHANRSKDIAFREGGTYDSATKGCGGTTYCHSDAASTTPPWSAPITAVKWSDKTNSMQCYSCHKGRLSDETEQACNAINGAWSSAKLYCTPSVTMSSNGHARLAGPRWIRKYPCSYCHNATIDASGAIADKTRHMNGKDVEFSQQWAIAGRSAPSYDKATKTCDNIYCHSDGTADPEEVKPFPWTRGKTHCNTCHGHPLEGCDNTNCHDGETHADDGLFWPRKTGWPAGEQWKSAVPMFRNEGPASARANSHPRHAETDFTCDNCHAVTIKQSNGSTSCYGAGCHVADQPIPTGSMSEAPHLNAGYHVNKIKDVIFKDGGTYNEDKSCTNTKCHTGRNLKDDPTFKLSLTDPVWGGTTSSLVCVSCHGTTTADVDSFGPTNSTRARINTTEWVTAGHGRMSSASNSRYPGSGNPAANFPINPCWYCHDNRVLHNSSSDNPFRLRLHNQFQNRFSKECVYCHMEGKDSECLECHNAMDHESLAPQLSAIFYSMTARWPDGTMVERQNHAGYTTCTSSSCHYVDLNNPKNDLKIHNQGAGFWSRYQKEDVKNQYVMMGVCLKCHDDDSGGKCTACHPGNQAKYGLGFDPGTGFIKPKVARATSAHFGYKHYRALMNSGVDYGQGMTGWNNYTGHSVGTWKGGKFCWDCHDPHGDSNIYMIQGMVATSTDGRFGIPLTRETVVFTRKMNGGDYTTFDTTANKYTGICNVCHSSTSKHYTSTSADSHNASKICTTCHEHRFTDSHADKQPCNSCHKNKPVPRHSGFGLPRDCTKCHTGTLGKRMDIMGQFGGTSHHVQGVEVTNKHCYACHWEATKEGVIDNRYHEGYNYKSYTSVKNAKSDLVVWQPGQRPTWYNTTTAVQFLASKVSFGILSSSRKEVGKLNNHCIGCHNDQNNDSTPFDDCKTPRQYAWDYKSIDARYNPQGNTTTPWGKYISSSWDTSANGKSGVTKALSAHGNAKNNQGGWSAATGVDSDIPNLRDNSQNVQCYDCHSSHGSKLVGVTSSYVTFNGTRNGGNLKETVAGSGGYNMTYKASANASGINPYSAGAGQCFDCHLTQDSGTTPWGYSTFGLSAPVKGYFDTDRFASGTPAYMVRYPYKTKSMKGGHFKAYTPLPVLGNHTTSAQNKIRGLCTPCHDPHGVSPSIEPELRQYAVPMLKGTWMTSPYKEDAADTESGKHAPYLAYNYGPWIAPIPFVSLAPAVNEDVSAFAGLCVQCHSKSKLTGNGANQWKGVDRIHTAVKGWSTKQYDWQVPHKYSCSKCHLPHVSALPRLNISNCLDYKHKGRRVSGGYPGYGSNGGSQGAGGGAFPRGGGGGSGEYSSSPNYQGNCHPAGAWPDNSWNSVTPW